jgi:hypothetical protein
MLCTEHDDIMFIDSPDATIREVKRICELISPAIDTNLIGEVFTDTLKLFHGEYPGYRSCNTGYHDLDHTIAVFLATARLIHGMVLLNHSFNPHGIFLGLTAALFHDAGFIQTKDDLGGTGAKYTLGHEERSIEFVRTYFATRGLSKDDGENCSHMIACTILRVTPSQIPFPDSETALLGKIVGTADLLAQMADRNYLEKLLFLYKEFVEAGVPGFESEMELLQKTESFYKEFSKKRMEMDLGNLAPMIRHHFVERWGIDQDLYEVCILKNIDYLKSILESIDHDYHLKLRRGGIVTKLKERS